MNENEEIYFDMDENMGSYYDFNLLDILDDNENVPAEFSNDTDKKLQVKLG
jgi:hypothetical protein